MTNGEKYKTAKERADAFKEYLRTLNVLQLLNTDITQSFMWLDLEAEEENPLPCPFCGGETTATANFGGVHFVMCDCGYSSTETSDKESAVAAHNRVAKAAKEGDAR